MIGIALQSGVSVDVNSPGLFQWAVTVAIIVTLFAVVTGLLYWARYAGLPDDRASIKATLLRERYVASPEFVKIPGDADRQTIREHVLAAAEDAREEEEESVRFRDVFAAVRTAIGEAWAPALDRIPTWSRRVAEYGIVLGLAGAIALEEAAITDALETGVATDSVWSFVGDIATATGNVMAVAVDTATYFPFLDMLWAFTFAMSILVLEWLYSHWYLTAPTIIAGAVVVAWAEYRLGPYAADLQDSHLVDSPWSGALSVVWALVTVWGAGVVPAFVGSVVGFATIGAGLGFVLSMVQLGRVIRDAGRWLHTRVRTIASFSADRTSRVAATWIVVRHVWTVLILATAPILAAYLVVIGSDGNLVRVLGALAGASLEIQVGLLLVVAVPVWAVAVELRESAPPARETLRRVLSQRAYHAKLVGQGLPLALVAIGYVIGYGLTNSIVFGGVFALVLGLLARWVYGKLIALRHRAEVFGGDPEPGPITCEVYPPITDGESDIYAVARVDGEWLLEDGVQQLTTDVATAIDEETTTTAHWRAKAAFGSGIVDAGAALRKAEERTRKRLFNHLRPVNSRSTVDDVDDAVEELPSSIVEDVRERYGDAIVEQDGYVWLAYDPHEHSERRSIPG